VVQGVAAEQKVVMQVVLLLQLHKLRENTEVYKVMQVGLVWLVHQIIQAVAVVVVAPLGRLLQVTVQRVVLVEMDINQLSLAQIYTGLEAVADPDSRLVQQEAATGVSAVVVAVVLP